MTEVLKPARSLISMVLAGLLSMACGVVQIFWIPRLLTVSDYGYWRAFLLYAGYAGLVHLGLVDGALLRWSSHADSSRPDDSALRRTYGFLIALHLPAIILAVGWCLLTGSSWLKIMVVLLLLYSALLNLGSINQVYLQAHHRFRELSFCIALPTFAFTVYAVLLSTIHATLGRLLAGYLVSWGLALAVLRWFAMRTGKETSPSLQRFPQAPAGTWRAGLAYISAGWPIMLANVGFGVMQSADRVTVNMTRPIQDFAIYALSQSTIYAPITVLASSSRVAFSWFARTSIVDRDVQYRSSTRYISLLWALLLPYFFLVEFIVRHYLHRYINALAPGRILLLSVLFLGLIQIVHFNHFNLHGLQRQFFLGSIAAVAFAFAAAWVGSTVMKSLSAVAWSQVLVPAIWWLANEIHVRRDRPGWRSDIVVVYSTFLLAAIALYGSVLGPFGHTLPRILFYYASLGLPLWLMYRNDIRYLWALRPGRGSSNRDVQIH